MNNIETIVILAASKGERIKPYSDFLPKVLLPIIDKPIIIWHIERAEKIGVKNAIIIIEERIGHILKESINAGYKGKIKLSYVVQKNRKGYLHAIKIIKNLINKNFILALGDEYDFSGNFYNEISEAKNDCDVCLSLIRKNKTNTFSEDETIITKNKNVLFYSQETENIESKWVFGGILFSNKLFLNYIEECIDQNRAENNFELIFNKMIKDNINIKFIEDMGPHINLNSIQDYWNFNINLIHSINPLVK